MRFFFIGGFICALFSCNSEINKHISINKYSDLNDSTVLKREIYLKKIRSEQAFKKVKGDDSLVAHGYYKEFDENGTLRLLAFYKNNEIDSVCYSYSKEGKIKERQYYFQNEMHGPQYLYYDNGNVMRVSICLHDKQLFSATYSLDGSISRLTGRPLHLLFDREIKSFTADAPIVVINLLPIVPRVKTIFNVKILNNNKTVKTYDIHDFFYADNFHMYIFNERLGSGLFRYIGKVTLLDSITSAILKEDTLQFDMNLK